MRGKAENNISKTANNYTVTNESYHLLPLQLAHFDVQYAIVNSMETQLIRSPFDGFLNIFSTVSQSGCIIPYFINLHTFLIRGEENILHITQKGDTLEWKNIHPESNAIILFIPFDIIPDFKSKYQAQPERFAKGYCTKSDNRIKLITHQILDLNLQESSLKELRIQALFIDLIVHQIEGLFVENPIHEIISNKNYYDFVMMAQQLIDKDLSVNYTIAELAKQVGTNEQYLKKYFKQYFGKTIMNYITERKMNYAKELIMTGNYRVVDVARLTGYKHATHFTTAFKKFFGFIPNSLKYTFIEANDTL